MRYRKYISRSEPKTIMTKLATFIRYFESKQITFKKNFIRNQKGKASEAISKEHVPDKSEIARIMEYLPIQAKTLGIVPISSGMRLGEAMKIRLDHLELDHDPAKINFKADYTKTKKS